jgi:hypothetical protein
MKPSAKPCRAQLTRAAWITVDLFIFLIGKAISLFLISNTQRSILVISISPLTAAGILVYVEFFAQNVKRGFFCGDKSISFEHRKDTVRMSTIIVYGLTPFLFVSVLSPIHILIFCFQESFLNDVNNFTVTLFIA